MILLDTHAWIWWATESPRLSAQAGEAIEQADRLGVHIISCWEIAMLSEKRRIVFNMDVSAWIDLALRHPKITLLPFEPQTAVLAARLENFHGDPADRFLAATCLIYNIPLVTRDRLIHNWQRIRTIW